MEENKIKNFFNIENRTKYFIHVLVFLCFATVAVFSLLLLGNKAISRQSNEKSKVVSNPFNNISLQAKSAVVWDVVNEQAIFSKDADEPLPLASLTKIMTALTLQDFIPKQSNVRITSEYLAPEGDSGLVVGDSWNVSDLRDFTLLTSSNDGALALASVAMAYENGKQSAESAFINAMNAKAGEIGLSNSKFFNEHGLDRTKDKGGAYGSARDMALLIEYILKNEPDILEATRYKSLTFLSNEKTYAATNTNTFVDKIPGIIASKTGYTDLAGGNLVVAYDPGLNRPIVIAVLGSTQEGRFEDALKLVNASLEYIHDN